MDVERQALQTALDHAAGAFAFEGMWSTRASRTEQCNAVRALKNAMKALQATIPSPDATRAERGVINFLVGPAAIEAEISGGFAEFPPEPIRGGGTDWRGGEAVRHTLAQLQAALPAAARVESWASKALEFAEIRVANARREARRKKEPLRKFERILPLIFLLFFGRKPGISSKPTIQDYDDFGERDENETTEFNQTTEPSGPFLEFWLACLDALGEPASKDAVRTRWRQIKPSRTGPWWDRDDRTDQWWVLEHRSE